MGECPARKGARFASGGRGEGWAEAMSLTRPVGGPASAGWGEVWTCPGPRKGRRDQGRAGPPLPGAWGRLR